MNENKTYSEVKVRDIPIGVLIAVVGLYLLYVLAWLAGFPGILSLLTIIVLTRVIEFFLYLSYRVVTGINIVVESEVINESSDNNSKQSIDAGRNITPPE